MHECHLQIDAAPTELSQAEASGDEPCLDFGRFHRMVCIHDQVQDGLPTIAGEFDLGKMLAK